jgi:rSAM/selenodomain-associated transferase 2
MSPANPLVSVVIPVRGDTAPLQALLAGLRPGVDVQVIVSAAGEVGPPERALRTARPDVVWLDGPPGRGLQLNAGAAQASGRWLWFVHADSRLPPGWLAAFRALDADPAIAGGSFAFALDSAAWQARVLERAVALRVRLFGLAYGDQGLFARRDVFAAMGGFPPWPLMEDVEFVRRLTRQGATRHLSLRVTTSARRWEQDGWWRRSAANLLTLAGWYAGIRPERLARRYYRETPDRPRS